MDTMGIKKEKWSKLLKILREQGQVRNLGVVSWGQFDKSCVNAHKENSRESITNDTAVGCILPREGKFH